MDVPDVIDRVVWRCDCDECACLAYVEKDEGKCDLCRAGLHIEEDDYDDPRVMPRRTQER